MDGESEVETECQRCRGEKVVQASYALAGSLCDRVIPCPECKKPELEPAKKEVGRER